MEGYNFGMIKVKMKNMVLILYLLSFGVHAKNFVKVGDEIRINLCNGFSGGVFYDWSFVSKPEISLLKNEDIDSDSCETSFFPDVKGEYKIKFVTNNYEKVFFYVALNNLEKSKLTLYHYHEDKIFCQTFDYYNDYEQNELIFEDKNQLIKYNFEVEGIVKITDLDNFDSFSANSKYDILLKPDNRYILNFFPDNYKNKEVIIDTFDFNGNISFDVCNKIIEVNIVNFDDRAVKGYLNIFYKNGVLKSFYINKKTSLKLCGDIEKAVFTPFKSDKNIYFNILLENFGQNEIDLKYKEITTHSLRINFEDIVTDDLITLKITSKNTVNCLSDSSIKCEYQQSFLLRNNKTISLPDGTYNIEVMQKKAKTYTQTILLNEDNTMNINLSERKETVRVYFNLLPDIAIFSDMNNNHYFFIPSEFDDVFLIPKGTYNIELFTREGIYELYSVDILYDKEIKYNWRELNIKTFRNDNPVNGGIISDNKGRYIYNDGKKVKFYIEN